MYANVNVNANSPWTEKYRPKEYNHVVFDETNKIILDAILSKPNIFPNLLLYGPPGTGKTTTIINLINRHKELYATSLVNEHAGRAPVSNQGVSNQGVSNQGVSKEMILHLNASDERGIDVIRGLIMQFITAKNVFHKGLKFVILDEVDYMTKIAQQGLKNILQMGLSTVKFCLICNYISRIDEGLQNEFVKLRFHKLPDKEVIQYLQKINKAEDLQLSKTHLVAIKELYHTDIRSMVNYLQSNKYQDTSKHNILTTKIYDKLNQQFKTKKIKTIMAYIDNLCITYNVELKPFIIGFLNWYILNNTEAIETEFLTKVEKIVHYDNYNGHYLLNYFVYLMYKN